MMDKERDTGIISTPPTPSSTLSALPNLPITSLPAPLSLPSSLADILPATLKFKPIDITPYLVNVTGFIKYIKMSLQSEDNILPFYANIYA